jgi:hypothetical protein
MKTPLLSLSLLALGIATAQPAAISFNAVGASSGGMLLTDTAGALANVPNWNNMFSLQTNAGGPITGSLLLGTVVDSAGTLLAGTSVTWSGTGVANAAGSGSNDQRMFESEWDLFNNNINVVDMTIAVANIPYPLYDVYFYVQDANFSAERGGIVSANGVEKAIRMFQFPGNIPGGPFAYVEADSLPPWSATTTAQGTYVYIPNLSGDLLLQLTAKNPTTPRLRFSGFQIVQVPEPSRALLVAFGILSCLSLRRRHGDVDSAALTGEGSSSTHP